MEQYLRIFCGRHQSDWAEWLACAEFSINNKINSSTGYSPFFLAYGRNPPRPLQPVCATNSGVPHADDFTQKMNGLTKESSAALTLANATMKRSFDKQHQDLQPFSPGTLVLLDGKGLETQSPSRKLDNKHHGPFKIIERIGEVSYRIELPPSWKIHDVFHISKLVPFTTPSFNSQIVQSDSQPVPPPLLNKPASHIAQILAHKSLRNTRAYTTQLTSLHFSPEILPKMLVGFLKWIFLKSQTLTTFSLLIHFLFNFSHFFISFYLSILLRMPVAFTHWVFDAPSSRPYTSFFTPFFRERVVSRSPRSPPPFSYHLSLLSNPATYIKT